MHALSEVVHSAKQAELEHGWMRLLVRLRASADQLIMAEQGSGLRSEVQHGCQAYLEMITQAAARATSMPAADALDQLRRQSTRYLASVSESTTHLVAHGGDLLTASLRKGGTLARNATAQTGAVMGPGTGLGRSALGVGGFVDGGRDGRHSPMPTPTLPHQSGSAAGGSVSMSDADGGDGPGPCVLTHGYSREVVALLQRAAKREHFTLLVAEDRPDGSGHRTASEMADASVPVRMIEFAAVARCMASVQLVLVGADAVLADGGILAPIGTLTIAYAARAHGRPFYVAAPHHLFCSTHHLDAAALTVTRATEVATPSAVIGGAGGGSCGAPAAAVSKRSGILREGPSRDATPPSLVTLLLTDVGVLTTEAVADHALQMRA